MRQQKIQNKTNSLSAFSKQVKLTVGWIKLENQQFEDKVVKTVSLRGNLAHNSQCQRCSLHSIVLSLYCLICRRMICASCMYNSSIHKKHRVIPLDNASEELKNDILAISQRLDNISKENTAVINSNTKILNQTQNSFSLLKYAIKQFYQDLKHFCISQEKQQIQYLVQREEAIKKEILQSNYVVSRMDDFLKMKNQTHKELKQKQFCFVKSIAENLIQIRKYTQNLLLNQDLYKFPADKQRVSITQAKIKEIILMLIPNLSIPQQTSRKTIKQPENSKSSISSVNLQKGSRNSKIGKTKQKIRHDSNNSSSRQIQSKSTKRIDRSWIK